jgi:hypothetical protein
LLPKRISYSARQVGALSAALENVAGNLGDSLRVHNVMIF